MKNFKLLTLLASVLLFGFYACSDESAFIDSAAINQSNALMQNLAKFNSKYAEFDDDKALVDFYKSYSDLDDVKRLEFMKTLPYQTLQSFLIDLQKPFEGFKSKEEFVNYLNGSDYLKLVTQNDGIDKVVEVSPSYHFAAYFINKDKIIKVGNTYRKYFGDFMVESNDYSALLPVNESNFKRCGLQYSKVVEALENNNSRNELNYLFQEFLTNDPSGCTKDRRIEFSCGMFANYSGPEYLVQFVSKVIPYHRNLFCSWSDYKTDIYWNNFDFRGTLTVNGITVNFNQQRPNETINAYIFDRSGPFWGTGPVTNGSINATFFWSKKRSSVSHRGMNGVYIESY